MHHLNNLSLALTGVLEVGTSSETGPVLIQSQECSIKALPSLQHLDVAALRSWDSHINVIDFIAQLTHGTSLKSLTFKCQLKFRETISFWKVVSQHAQTLVSLSAPWWYPTTDILRRLGTNFSKLESLIIGRMSSLDVCSIEAVRELSAK